MARTLWWFVLGREPLLSLAELAAVLSSNPDLLTPDIAKFELANEPGELIKKLGGTVKIAKELAAGLTEEALLDRLALELDGVTGKIHFGLSLYAIPKGSEWGYAWGLALKKRLKAKGKSIRFVDNRGKAALSSVSVDKNGLITKGREFLIVPQGKGFAVAQSVAVQPFESFSQRDFGRPGRDDTSGMLPPKLAMMMINLSGATTEKILLDPFCGSGTIISEAMLLGFTKLIGTDASPKAIEDTKKNLEWLATGKLRAALKISVCDAAKLPTMISDRSVDVVVTEPYLGPPLKGRESPEQLRISQAALQKLYKQAFASFTKILRPNATVVFIFPRFQTSAGWISVAEGLVADLKKDGFEPVPLLPQKFSKTPYLLYHREGQRVGREIWRFRFAS